MLTAFIYFYVTQAPAGTILNKEYQYKGLLAL